MYEIGRSGENIKELNNLKNSLQIEINALNNQIKPIKFQQGKEAEKTALQRELASKEQKLKEVSKALEYGAKDMTMTKAGQAASVGIAGGGRYAFRQGGEAGKDYAMNKLDNINLEIFKNLASGGEDPMQRAYIDSLNARAGIK